MGKGDFNSTDGHSDTAIIRLSEGDSTTFHDFGILGLMDFPDVGYSSLSSGNDLILHQHQDGDIIITNYSRPNASHAFGTSIRFATTGDTTTHSIPLPSAHDLERMTIMGNGNVGIDLPPSITGLDSVKEQFQLGGGSLAPTGELDPLPGLSFYGGNRFEGLPYTGGTASVDWRYIGFNEYHNPWTGAHYRSARMGTSSIGFSEGAGGLIQLSGVPYDSSMSITASQPNTVFQISGQQGLSLWSFVDTSDLWHHLFDVYPPGYLASDLTRNTNGLSFFHTPLYIGSDAGESALVDLQNLPVRPDMGDDTTWMLVVNGAALFKEAWVNSSDWPDYVFLPNFKLMSIKDFGNFLETNHHLPELPAAKTMNAGIPLGQTEEELTKQVEEMARYIVQLNKEVEALKADMNDLKNQKEK